MGRPFLQFIHTEHEPRFICACCSCDVASFAALEWEGWMGHQEPAYLMRSTVNVEPCGQLRREELSSGEYTLVDVRCKSCGLSLGWKYLEAQAPEQRYKEGSSLIKQSLVELVQDVPPGRATEGRLAMAEQQPLTAAC